MRPNRPARGILRLPGSLRWRLTAFVAAVMLGSAALASVVIYLETGNRLKSEIDQDLRGDVTQLRGALVPLADRPGPVVHAAARRYVNLQSYTATSRLLFVLMPGYPPVSNHPDVLAAGLIDDGESAVTQAAENRAGRALRQPHLGYSTQRVPDVGKVRILETPARLGGSAAIIGAGEPLAAVQSAQQEILRAFALVAALSLVLALIASYVAGTSVTAPLRRMASVATRVDEGDLEPRMEPYGPQGSEVRVLADAFNHMLDRLAVAFEGQRGFVADASHELRTPLTVIRGQLEVLAALEHPSAEDVARAERQVQAEVIRMTRLVDDLLLLAAAGRVDFVSPEPIELSPFVTELWDGLSLTADRRFELGEVPAGVLRADPDRLAQGVRNLARNAIEHTASATGLVRLEVSPLPGGRISFAVIDDGPGIPIADRERVFERLYRIDGARSRASGGAGLGLAIVRAIAEAHGGSASADEAPGGGARVELVLPGFIPARSPRMPLVQR
jgi:signal transduction histidine kinase